MRLFNMFGKQANGVRYYESSDGKTVTIRKEDFLKLLDSIPPETVTPYSQELISKYYTDQFLNSAAFRDAINMIDLTTEEINENTYIYVISKVCKLYEDQIKKVQNVSDYWQEKLNKAFQTILEYQNKLETANKKEAK